MARGKRERNPFAVNAVPDGTFLVDEGKNHPARGTRTVKRKWPEAIARAALIGGPRVSELIHQRPPHLSLTIEENL